MPHRIRKRLYSWRQLNYLEEVSIIIMAVLWLRRLVASLPPWRPGFAQGSVDVGFVVDKVALGQVSLQALHFYPVNIIPSGLSILIYHLGDEQ
jgi:hypothetical protein